MQRRNDLRILVEGAIFAGLAMALEYVPHDLGVSSVQLSYGLIPLGVYSLRRGPVPGMLAGLVWGLLDMWLRGSGSLLNPVQIILEYPVAFGIVGVIGVTGVYVRNSLHAGKTNQAVFGAVSGFIIGDFLKYLCHYFAGVFFWGSYAPKGQSAWIYSLVINGGSFIANLIMGVIVFALLVRVTPQLFTRNLE